MNKYDSVIKHNWNNAFDTYTVPDKLDRDTWKGAVAGLGLVVIAFIVFTLIAAACQPRIEARPQHLVQR